MIQLEFMNFPNGSSRVYHVDYCQITYDSLRIGGANNENRILAYYSDGQWCIADKWIEGFPEEGEIFTDIILSAKT